MNSPAAVTSASIPIQNLSVILQLARFVAIGALNTAIDFLILNFLAVMTGIETGGRLGLINVVGFGLATIHSYFWNRSWTFGQNQDLKTTLLRSFALGSLAFIGLVAAVAGAKFGSSAPIFAVVIVGFLAVEVALWKAFHLKLEVQGQSSQEFAKFSGVSIVGLGINSGLLVAFAWILGPYAQMLGGSGIVRNLAKALATGVSLIWNFLGYKLLVFKK